MLFAIGAGDQVIAVDDFSNYPAEAAAKMHRPVAASSPNVEAIAGLRARPRRHRRHDNADRRPARRARASLTGTGPAAVTFDDIYAQIEQLGAATGHVAEAAELVGQMQTDIADG